MTHRTLKQEFAKMRRIWILGLVVAVLAPSFSQAQLFHRFQRPAKSYSVPNQVFTRVCPGATCDLIQPQSGFTVAPVAPVVTTELEIAQATIVADSPQVQMRISGACGTGFAMGNDGTFTYYGTNAHVVSTRPGTQVQVGLEVNSQRRNVTGEVVLAMFDSRKIIDFAIVRVRGVTHRSYLPMLKTAPDAQPFRTKGSPGCVWPLVDKPFNNPIISDNSPLIRGLPNAIGGQSGSSIYNSNGATIAVLAWSWGGYCAGQQTHWLWKAATERSFSDVPGRPTGMIEVADEDPITMELKRPITQDGIFELQETSTGRAPTEDGIFNFTDSRIADLPIWYSPGGGGGGGDPDCMQLTTNEKDLIEFLRLQQQQSAFGDFLKSIDWVKVMKQVIEIIKLIQSLQ